MIGIIEMIEKVTLPEMQKGEYRIEHFITDDRVCFSDIKTGRNVPIGQKFTRLMRGLTVVMSDTPAEIRDMYFAYNMAKGSCLINGLGLGILLNAVLKKDSVTDVIVVEKSKDVFDLVAPFYQSPKCTIVLADAFDYKPEKGKKFDMVWHDIWDNICADNLPEMHKLHRKYGCKAKWQGSWCREECKRYA